MIILYLLDTYMNTLAVAAVRGEPVSAHFPVMQEQGMEIIDQGYVTRRYWQIKFKVPDRAHHAWNGPRFTATWTNRWRGLPPYGRPSLHSNRQNG